MTDVSARLQLHIPGCSPLTPGSVGRAVEKLNNPRHLRVHGVPRTKKEHRAPSTSLLRVNPQRPLVFYKGQQHSSCSFTDNHPYIDVDICPECNEVGFVFN
ncbi:hypothetical protein MRB53_029993 [Persea americana]|uniref:Uncharacterized protein n=1 Tax=Persea americana TaxID=3435 RepID=A0ACC2KKG1_PERAE|nr:hypothetical protein MRB53_029993 [Persea americana]